MIIRKKLRLCAALTVLVWSGLAVVSARCAGAAPAQRQFALQALSSRFWDLVPRGTKLTKFATGFGFTEGPVWDPRGFLYVSDEIQNRIYRIERGGRRETVIALGDPDGNTYDLNRHLIDCASVLRGVIRVSPDGHYTMLAGRYEGKRFNSPNDAVVGPDHALYFTDPTLDLPKGQKQEIPFQGVYRLDDRGNVTLLTRDLTQPNGLAFSPDGKRIVSRETSASTIFRADGSATDAFLAMSTAALARACPMA